MRKKGSSTADAAVQPTPDADVNAALTYFLAHTQAILDQRFVGMYLDGSLVLGDFDPKRSDIDFLVVTDADLPDDVLEALQEMHTRFATADSPWAVEIEASYIPQGALRRFNPQWNRHPRIQRGDPVVRMEDHEADWVIHRYILREHGVALAGPDVRRLIDPISPQDLRSAVMELMRIWWAPMAHNPAKLRHAGYWAYAILTMCRVLYTLETRGVASKPAAARWARQTLGPRWTTLIDGALAWQKDMPPAVAERQVQEAADLIRYIAERCQERSS